MPACVAPRLSRFLALAILLPLDVRLAAAPADALGVVLDFEQSLRSIPKEEDRVAATRKFFGGLKDSATKIQAVGAFDSRYVYAVPRELADEVLGKLLQDPDLKVRVR